MPSQTPRRTLIKGATVLTMDRQLGDFACADVLIEDKLIVAVGPGLKVDGAEVIDASNAIVLPGLVDAHRHAWQGSLRRVMPNVDNLDDYVDATHYTLGKFYRPQDMHIGNLLTALSCLDGGTTTIVDASHNARSPEHTDACIDALQQAGIRALHMPGRPLAGDWANHWPHDLERLKASRFPSDDQLLTLGVFCMPDPATWTLARRLGIRTLTEFLGPMAPMLAQVDGLLGPDNIFNHCTSLPDEVWRVFAAAGVSVTVDARSDAQYALAGGIFAWQSAIDHGMRPGIGTDLETAYGGDMFSEMRVAFSLQRAVAQSRRHEGAAAPLPVSVRAILEAATIDGARCAGIADRTGSLTPGKQADLILIRTDNVSLYPPNNAIGTVVHAAERAHVDTVMVAGRLRKRGGILLDVDFARIKRDTDASLAHLFSAGGYQPDILEERFPVLAGDKPAAWDGTA